VTASQLTALGLPEFMAADQDDYIERAVNFARHPQILAELSHDLRARMQKSPLMDASGLTAEVESLYLQSWLQYTDT
jgi:predicted O-linked N-acetylglucosamine transferase (SPINDLY family)